MTPPLTCGIQSETFHRIDPVCEAPQPVCEIAVPILVEDQANQVSRVIDVVYCSEELHRMSPPPALFRRLQRMNRRQYVIPLRPQRPVPHQQPAAPQPPAQRAPATPPTMNQQPRPSAPHPSTSSSAPQTSSQTGSVVVPPSRSSQVAAAAAGAAAGVGAALGAAVGGLVRGAGRALRGLSR